MIHLRLRVDPVAAGKTPRLAAIAIFFGYALLGAAPSWSESADAQALFAEAAAAFEAEDYSKARALFELARDAGMDGPAIHYNIGAAAYLGGDLPGAEREFRKVARTPTMAAIAHYNLGLVALDRRDEREAREWFNRTIYEDTPDERLYVLASRRLEELPEARTFGAWSYYTRGGVGYDDNIALRSTSIESQATGERDSFGELTFAGSYTFGAWRFDTSGGMIEYMDLDEFSQSSFSLGVARGFRTDNWYFEVGAYGAQQTLGGEVFERNVAGGLRVTRAFAGGSRLRAQLLGTAVDGKGAFTGLTGDRKELGLYYDKHWRSWNFGAHTRGEVNDSEDPIFASRWIQLGADARYTFTPMWGVSLSAALRRTRHPAQLAIPGWDDNRSSFQLGATRALWKQAQLFVRLEHERNVSPVAGYDYDRNRILASVEAWR